MNGVYLKLNGVADNDESMGTLSPLKAPQNAVKPLWRISDLACLENVADQVRFVEANIYCLKQDKESQDDRFLAIGNTFSQSFQAYKRQDRRTPAFLHHPSIFNMPAPENDEPAEEHREYALYKHKLKGLESEFYHYDFMAVLNLISKFYFQEPTCHELVKSFRKIEKAFLFCKHD